MTMSNFASHLLKEKFKVGGCTWVSLAGLLPLLATAFVGFLLSFCFLLLVRFVS